MIYLYVFAFAASLAMVYLLTPIVKKFAMLIGAVDVPNHRKVHTKIMPRLGGLAILPRFSRYFLYHVSVAERV